MTTNTIPDDIVEAAEDAAIAIGQTDGDLIEATAIIAQAIHDAVMAERERCARLIEEGYERGIANKRDTSAHGKFEWEDCDECVVAAIRATPKAEEA